MHKIKLLCCCLLMGSAAFSQTTALDLPSQQPRWRIDPDGSIYWPVGTGESGGRSGMAEAGLPHSDHIEMSGEKVSLWVQYEVDSARRLHLKRTVVFPTFRMKPNNTHASMMLTVQDGDLPRFFINNRPLRADVVNGSILGDLPETVTGIRQHGIMQVYSKLEVPAGGRKGKGGSGTAKAETPGQLTIRHSLFPGVTQPLAIEQYVFSNTGDKPVTVEMEYQQRDLRIDTTRSFGIAHHFIQTALGAGAKVLQPGDSVVYAVSYQATDDPGRLVLADPQQEEQARMVRIGQILEPLQLHTPDSILNTAFAFAKIRATESIYRTKAGYMHGPGGLAYYAAIWANDQAEYVNPFFAWLGDTVGVQSAMNAYRLFAGYMNPEYRPIPSSIIAEGYSFWNGAGDRGDQAMIAYGAARFALTCGNKDSAQKLWPLIEWCLEYCKRKINPDGVVASKSDELEGRFPAGEANLCTSSLYYDALLSAASLGAALGKPHERADRYRQEAKELYTAIEKYFGAVVGGFPTYRYYKGNEVLRAWICIPLTVGIYERKEGTIQALLSPGLFTADGLLTQAGDKTFWDRSTLYALRGILAAGETEQAMAYLKYYSSRRLLGEHVPYPIEAWPEGGQRHLSAESGLYGRIYLEGLFGMRPTGLRTFDCRPRLPAAWNFMELDHIRAFGNDFDLRVERAGKGRLKLRLTSRDPKTGQVNRVKEYMVREGGGSPTETAVRWEETVRVNLP